MLKIVNGGNHCILHRREYRNGISNAKHRLLSVEHIVCGAFKMRTQHPRVFHAVNQSFVYSIWLYWLDRPAISGRSIDTPGPQFQRLPRWSELSEDNSPGAS